MSFLKDFTGGNPFSTRVGQLVEQATDGAQASENWAMFMEICDVINESDEGPKDASKAIKKRFSSSGKNYTCIMYTLTVLETCVKNCGKRFHVYIAHKDFLQEMVKIIGPKNDPPTAVQEKVLSMIQNWADAFQGQADMKEIAKTYQELKNKGIEFPMTDLDSMAPIHTPARTGGPAGGPIDTLPASRPPQHNPSRQPPTTRGGAAPGYPTQPAAPATRLPPATHHHHQPPVPPMGPVTLGAEQLTKLKAELDVVQQNCKVFSEMLTELTPGQDSPSDIELLGELNNTCKQMQKRIMSLIDKIQNEEVTGELLHINDELNNVFLRYERFERLRGAGAGQRAAAGTAGATAAPTAGTTAASHAPPSYNGVLASSQPPAPAAPSQPPAAARPGEPAVANLIDFAETPSPKPAPQADPFSAGGGDLNAKLANLAVGGGALSDIPSTQAAAGSNSDDFDMFAQSRQSFEQNKQTLPGHGLQTYSAQQQDSYPGGLGSAVTAKSTGNPFTKDQLIDTEKDFAEMEAWLKENPGTTATSSEFDQFLQSRASDSQPTNAPSAANNRRQMQKDPQEDAMFAL